MKFILTLSFLLTSQFLVAAETTLISAEQLRTLTPEKQKKYLRGVQKIFAQMAQRSLYMAGNEADSLRMPASQDILGILTGVVDGEELEETKSGKAPASSVTADTMMSMMKDSDEATAARAAAAPAAAASATPAPAPTPNPQAAPTQSPASSPLPEARRAVAPPNPAPRSAPAANPPPAPVPAPVPAAPPVPGPVAQPSPVATPTPAPTPVAAAPTPAPAVPAPAPVPTPQPPASRENQNFRCMHSGWIVKKDPCTAQTIKSLDPANSKFQSMIDPAKLTCPKGASLCNPVLYGLKLPANCEKFEDCPKQAQALCATDRMWPTKECATISASTDKAYLVALHINAKISPELWNTYVRDFEVLCGPGRPEKNPFAFTRNGVKRKNPQAVIRDISETCAEARKQLNQLKESINISPAGASGTNGGTNNGSNGNGGKGNGPQGAQK